MLDEAVDLLTVAAATWAACVEMHYALPLSISLSHSLLPAARLYQFRSQICSFLGELFALG